MATKRMTPGFSDQVMGLVKALRTDAPDCVASGVVDMSTGMLLSYETVDNHPPEVLDLLAGATLDLFQGRTVVMIEDVFKQMADEVEKFANLSLSKIGDLGMQVLESKSQKAE